MVNRRRGWIHETSERKLHEAQDPKGQLDADRGEEHRHGPASNFPWTKPVSNKRPLLIFSPYTHSSFTYRMSQIYTIRGKF